MSRKPRAKPRVFVGSATESLDVSYALQEALEHDAEVTVWTQNVFELTKSALESLLKALDRYDFAVFVFAPSDTLKIRRRTVSAVRDNVIFELGLFIARLGRGRTFIVLPRNRTELHLPSDLAGVTPGTYDAGRRDKDLQAALGPFCNKLRKAMRKAGRRRRSARSAAPLRQGQRTLQPIAASEATSTPSPSVIGDRNARKILATLWKYQKKHARDFSRRWAFAVGAAAVGYSDYLAGLSKLLKAGLVAVDPDSSYVLLTNEGISFAQQHKKALEAETEIYQF